MKNHISASKSREAAIDYLNETRNKHLKNVSKEIERIRSLDNLLTVITTESDVTDKTNSILLSLMQQDESSDINTSDLQTGNESSDINNTSDIGKNAE